LKMNDDSLFIMFQHLETYEDLGGVSAFLQIMGKRTQDDHGYRTDGFDKEEKDFFSHAAVKLMGIANAQVFEYYLAHIFDKPAESFDGFLQQVPSSFILFRWKILETIIDDYLKPSRIKNYIYPDIYEANRYLLDEIYLC
jgi:hypothetical protein